MIDEYIASHGKRLYGLCLTLCRNSYDAEDLYQETWLKVMKSISQYRADQPFAPWLTKICVNEYRSNLRRLARSPIFNAFHSSEEKEQLFAAAAAPEKDDYSDLHGAIDRLPEKLRLTVILFYFEDMDIDAVSRALSIPPGTVKSRIYKARNKLKEELQNAEYLSF